MVVLFAPVRSRSASSSCLRPPTTAHGFFSAVPATPDRPGGVASSRRCDLFTSACQSERRRHPGSRPERRRHAGARAAARLLRAASGFQFNDTAHARSSHLQRLFAPPGRTRQLDAPGGEPSCCAPHCGALVCLVPAQQRQDGFVARVGRAQMPRIDQRRACQWCSSASAWPWRRRQSSCRWTVLPPRSSDGEGFPVLRTPDGADGDVHV